MGYNILLTGRPGVGKTTVFLKILDLLKDEGVKIGGFVSREVRVRGRRIGFTIEDLYSGNNGWLAKIDNAPGLRVGKYRVILKDLERVGLKALQISLDTPEITLIAVDEIAIMELQSPLFKKIIIQCLYSKKNFVGTLQIKLRDEISSWIGKDLKIDMIEVRIDNRDEIVQILYDTILKESYSF